MKKVILFLLRYIQAMLAAVLLLAPGGCAREDGEGPVPEARKGIWFAVEDTKTPPIQTSRGGGGLDVSFDPAAYTRGVDDDAAEVNDVWIVQFDGSGNRTDARYLTVGDVTKDTRFGYTAYTTDVELVRGKNVTVCIVANTGDPALFSTTTTLGDFEDMVLALGDTREQIEESARTLMTGYYHGKVPHANIEEPVAWVGRLGARIDLALNYRRMIDGVSIFFTSVQLQHVPKSSILNDGEGEAGWLFPLTDDPATAPDNFIDY